MHLSGRALVLSALGPSKHHYIIIMSPGEYSPVVVGQVISLASVSRRDRGAYLCIASNGVPPAVSHRISLEVGLTSVLISHHILPPGGVPAQPRAGPGHRRGEAGGQPEAGLQRGGRARASHVMGHQQQGHH